MKSKYAFLGPLRKPIRKVYKNWLERRRLSDWRKLARRSADLARFAGAPDGPRLVHLPMIGRMFLTNFELCLSMALAGRGAKVEVIFDDAALPLCEMTTADVVAESQAAFCRNCIAHARKMLAPLPIKVRWVSEFVSAEQREAFRQRAEVVDLGDVLHYEEEGIPIGRPALMVAMRHFRLGLLGNSRAEQDVLRGYMVTAMVSRHIAEQACREGGIHAAMLSHGIYSSFEPALEAFKKHGVPVAVYDRQTGVDRYQFNWDVSPNSSDISGPWERTWKNRPLTDEQRRQAVEYVADRETFKNEAAKFSLARPEVAAELRADLGVPAGKTALLLVSNLVWDAAAVGRDLIFANTMEWVSKSIDIVSMHPDKLHLVVKPHPAEVMRGTKMFVGEEIRKAYCPLPANVTVLDAGAKINPQSLMKAMDVGISHTSTAGLEMAALGKPVIPVSMAHYRGKGFTFDPNSIEEYRQLLSRADQLPSRYTEEMKELALKYVHVRYFKYQHDLPLLREDGFLNCIGYKIRSFDDLLPGRIEHLDFVCDAILNKRTDFVRT
jgi:hypothetical protein